MIEEIKRKYKNFGDATIFRIEYLPFDNESKELGKRLIMYLNCYNWEINEWEKIRLTFQNIMKLRLVEEKRQISVIFEALLIEENGRVVIDFFPNQKDSAGLLEENNNSDLSIHSKSIFYQLEN